MSSGRDLSTTTSMSKNPLSKKNTLHMHPLQEQAKAETQTATNRNQVCNIILGTQKIRKIAINISGHQRSHKAVPYEVNLNVVFHNASNCLLF